MAKEIKTLKGTFDFTGVLTSKELKKSEKEGTNGRFIFSLLDKDMCSEIKLDLWEGSEASYWDSINKKVVKVTQNIPTVMKEIRANATGIPFSIKVIMNGSEKELFVNNEVIAGLSKLPLNKQKINVTGEITFEEYKQRVIKKYKIQKIEIGTNKPLGFMVKIPVVVSEESKDKFIYGETTKTLPIMVKTKLSDNAGYGYRPITLGLDQKYFLGGVAIPASKKLGVSALEIINNKVFPKFIEEMKGVKGYCTALLIGRLKVGEITKKPTIDDLNPMEKIVLTLQGDEAIQEKLDAMEMVTEYFDSLFFHSFDAKEGVLFECISESELNLPKEQDSTINIGSNPMLDVMANLGFGDKPNTEDSKDELLSIVDTVESEVLNESENNDDFDDSEFPF